MKSPRLSIGARLTIYFALGIIFTAVVGLLALSEMNQLARLTGDIYDHPLTVGYAMRDIRGHVYEMHNIVQALRLGSSDAELATAMQDLDGHDREIMRGFALVKQRFLGDVDDVQAAEDAYLAWMPLRQEKLDALESGAAFAEAAYDHRSDLFLASLLDRMQVMIDFAAAKAISFRDHAEAEQTAGMRALLALLVCVTLAGLGIAYVTARSITTPLATILVSLRELATGDFSRPVEIRRSDEIGVLADALREIQDSLRHKTRQTEAIAAGDYRASMIPAGERDTLGQAIAHMTQALSESRDHDYSQDWIKTGLNELAVRMRGGTDLRAVAGKALGYLAPYLDAQIATLYLVNDRERLVLTGSYAFAMRNELAEEIELGQGLVGQAALEREPISITRIPEGYLRINSSFGDHPPRALVAVPLLREDDVVGVMELGSFEEFPPDALELLGEAAESMAVTFSAIQKQARVEALLARTQEQAGRLSEQQEELRASNEELEEHTQALRRSEEELKQQREELQALNEELEEKNTYLEQQKALVLQQNSDLDQTRRDLERKAAELEATSRYKSEFLANMSHELRTPLNSLLLLSRNLHDNASGRLGPDDVQAAGIIYKNGNDLLDLINDILDLSKIEAGKMRIHIQPASLAEVAEGVAADFRPQAEAKGLILGVSLDEELPPSIVTDSQRLGQILRNLLSNAVKFTETGEVRLAMRPAPAHADLSRSGLDPAGVVAFSVTDTGIGIPEDQHVEVFEAFQQVDGSTSRRYGGTGLGLSIVRELARLLGGEIQLNSTPEVGSTFTLYLPLKHRAAQADQTDQAPEPSPLQRLGARSPRTAPRNAASGPAARPPRPTRPPREGAEPAEPATSAASAIPDDRAGLAPGERSILIIEDDPHFAGLLVELCRGKGFKALAAPSGEDGLTLAERYLPTAVILDVRLPGIDGWSVLSALKESHRTRHIPVHMVSGHETTGEALAMGAIGFLAKPVSREDLDEAFARIGEVVDRQVKDLLLVEDNADLRRGILELVGDLGVNVSEVESGAQALEALAAKRFDCMILDIGLADMSGLELLKRLEDEHDSQARPIPPVIVYTGKELSKAEEKELSRYAESIIVKGVRSEERLLDEVTLFLHRMVSALPATKQRMIMNLHNRDAMLENKRVLVVDDDMRNLFAVSRVLEEKGMVVRKAEDGAKALEALEADPAVDMVLLDIMMPVMDGYETMRRIRKQPRFARLPIIALTAKAMKEDREKCIAAGASDYLAKPVDVDKLLSMLRVWLYGA